MSYFVTKANSTFLDLMVDAWCGEKKNEEFKHTNLRPTVKHGGGSVMVWACISSFGVGDLIFIDGTVNKEYYLPILKGSLLQSAAKMGIAGRFKLYQDNDPKHVSRLVQEWLLYHCPKVMHPPPQSLDLNPIENCWDELDRRVDKTTVSSLHELKKRLQEE